MKYVASLALLALSPMMYAVEPETGAQKRVVTSAEVLSDIFHAKDRGVPEDLIAKAQCVGIVPSLKRAGFIVGAKYGKA
jgi:SH3 domain-containing YSC84-like protein 1